MKQFLSVYRLICIVLALTWFAGTAARAQSLAALEECVARFGGASEAAETCSSQLHEACMASRPGQTTVDLAECMNRGHAIWDSYLNKLWKPMKADAQANGTWESLLASQRKWIAYRDAECERVYNEYGGGSLRLIAAPECLRDLTAQKTLEFYRALQR